MKFSWSKFFWRLLQTIIICVLNAGLIFFIVQKCIGMEVQLSNGKTMEVSLIEYWKWMKVWRWYYNIFLWGGIVAGVLLSYLFIKILYQNHRDDKKEKARDKKESERMDKFSKEMSKLMKDHK